MRDRIPTIKTINDAVRDGDAARLKSLYADDATVTIIDRDHPPSHPRVVKGARDIGAFLDDVYSRDMTHNIELGVGDDKTLAFIERCRYADGTKVIASNSVELGQGGIVRQVIVQAWDG